MSCSTVYTREKEMKKAYIAIVLLFVLATTMLLAACGDSKNSVVGSWRLTSVEFKGEAVEYDVASSGIIITLERNGRATMSTFRKNDEGTWKMNTDGTITVAFGDDTMEFYLENGCLKTKVDDQGNYVGIYTRQ